MNSNIVLDKIRLFHTTRGKKMYNQVIDKILNTFDIERSLLKGIHQYNTVVSETNFKVLKIEICNKDFI